MVAIDMILSLPLKNPAMNCLVSGVSPTRLGNAHPNIAPYEAFPVADGWIVIAVGNDAQFRRLAVLLDLPELEQWATNAGRVADRAALSQAISAQTCEWEQAALLADLEEQGIPAGPINTVAQALADPQTIARGMRLDLDDGHGNSLPSVRAPMVMSATPCVYERPSPRLGQHTDEILQELERSGK